MTEIEKPLKLFAVNNLLKDETKSDRLCPRSYGNPGCEKHFCKGAIYRDVTDMTPGQPPRPKSEIIQQATDFLREYYTELKKADSDEHKARIREVIGSIETTGSYHLTYDELSMGSKLAWRNAARCIGRIQWRNLRVIDARDAKTASDMFEYLKDHISYATNGGNIRSCITVFPQRTDEKFDFRVWNTELINYAGYKREDGTILGDPMNVTLTEVCQRLGWKGKGTAYDVLPLVLQANGNPPEYFEIPEELVMQVRLKHPKYDWFEELGIQWFTMPAVSYMMFDCGGIIFPASPFNGWYMSSEIAARDLTDVNRYNITKTVAEKMNLDTSKNVNLWKDKVLLEITTAVLYSFNEAGVTIVDHHTASEQFMSHLETEYKSRGGCPADWVWIVPPMSSSMTPVFHMEMINYKLKPSYEYQPAAWVSWAKLHEKRDKRVLSLATLAKAIRLAVSLMMKVLAKRVKCTILYATETGKSRSFAYKMADMAKQVFNVKVHALDEYDLSRLSDEELVFLIASTFGNGDPPANGVSFYQTLKGAGLNINNNNSNKFSFRNIRYSVFGLGSSTYETFCAFAEDLDNLFSTLGATQVHPLARGDELAGQEETFSKWSKDVMKVSCKTYSISDKEIEARMANVLGSIEKDTKWSANSYRYKTFLHDRKHPEHIRKGLEHIYEKKISKATVKQRIQLQHPNSPNKTYLLVLSTSNDNSLQYTPGDHVAIYPVNNEALVNKVLDRIRSPPSCDVAIQLERRPKTGQSDWATDTRLPIATSLRTALTYYLDITSAPRRTLLAQMARLCQDKEGRSYLQKLAEDDEAYLQWKNTEKPTLVDVLEKVPTLKLAASFVLSQLPTIRARYYSVSSSPDLYPGEIHLTIALTLHGNKAGHMKFGLCSDWLNNVEIGGTVNCFIRKVKAFALPDDVTLPVIMIGNGCGVAPFRSFWQQRLVEFRRGRQPLGPMYLFYGCQHPEKNNLHQEERSNLVKNGIITKEYTAFSRLHKQKVYVQDLVKKQGAELRQLVIESPGHVYICGFSSMAEGVKDTFIKILKKECHMSEAKARETLEKLKASGRWHEDIFNSG